MVLNGQCPLCFPLGTGTTRGRAAFMSPVGQTTSDVEDLSGEEMCKSEVDRAKMIYAPINLGRYFRSIHICKHRV